MFYDINVNDINLDDYLSDEYKDKRNKRLQQQKDNRKKREQEFIDNKKLISQEEKRKKNKNKIYGVFGFNSAYKVIDEEQYNAWNEFCDDYVTWQADNIVVILQNIIEGLSELTLLQVAINGKNECLDYLSNFAINNSNVKVAFNEHLVEELYQYMDWDEVKEVQEQSIDEFLQSTKVTFPQAKELILNIINGNDYENIKYSKIISKSILNDKELATMIFNILKEEVFCNYFKQENLIQEIIDVDCNISEIRQSIIDLYNKTMNNIRQQINETVDNIFEQVANHVRTKGVENTLQFGATNVYPKSVIVLTCIDEKQYTYNHIYEQIKEIVQKWCPDGDNYNRCVKMICSNVKEICGDYQVLIENISLPRMQAYFGRSLSPASYMHENLAIKRLKPLVDEWLKTHSGYTVNANLVKRVKNPHLQRWGLYRSVSDYISPA